MVLTLACMKTVIALSVIGLAGCASTASVEPLNWSSLGDGCHDRGLSEVLLSPEHFGTTLNLTDIRIGRLPDVGNGTGLVAHFRRGLNGAFGQPTREPQLFLAVGDWNRSCSVVLEIADCPESTEIYNQLAAQSIPIGHAFDDATGLTVIHGTKFFLSARDGHSNQMNWSYVGSEHRLRDQIDAALDDLSQCAAPASASFSIYTR